MSETRLGYFPTGQALKLDDNYAMLDAGQRRRLLACGLDELEREASQLERTAIQWVNQLRALQGKRPIIVPKE